MGVNQSKLPSPGDTLNGSLMPTLRPASSYTLKSAVEEGQKEFINHREQLHALQKLQESQSILYQTAEVRFTDHENRIVQLEERVFGVNFPGEIPTLNNEQEGVKPSHGEFMEDPASGAAASAGPNFSQNLNQFQDWGNEMSDAGYAGSPRDQPRVHEESRVHQVQRGKIQCEYCPKLLSVGYIRHHVRLCCPYAPMHKRAVRRGVCPHCGKDLSVQSLKRHLAAPCIGGWNFGTEEFSARTKCGYSDLFCMSYLNTC